MTNTRALLCLIPMPTFALPATAQEASEPDRAATGGVQMGEEIRARQRGEKIVLGLRHAATGLSGGASAAGTAGHIHIGSIGMEGAFDAMGTGEADEAWRRQHHSLWPDDVRTARVRPAGKPGAPGATLAE